MRIMNSDGRSIGQLFKNLKDDAALLLRQEVELAKLELKITARRVGGDLALIAAGVAAGLVAVILLLAALSIALAFLLALVTPWSIAGWLGPMVVGLIVLAVAGTLIQRGRGKLAQRRLAPQLTRQTLMEDTQWIREKLD